MAHEWLRQDGVAIVEVFHPSGWMSDDGLEEIREPSTDGRYTKRLGHRGSFDYKSSRVVDSWWEVGSSTVMSQSLRCYQLDEFADLARNAGLLITTLIDPVTWTDRSQAPDEKCWSYIAVLNQAG